MIKATAISLAICSLLLCSCAGFRLPPEEPTDNRPRIRVLGTQAVGERAVEPSNAPPKSNGDDHEVGISQSAPFTLADRRNGEIRHKVGTGHHGAEEAVILYRRDMIAGQLRSRPMMGLLGEFLRHGRLAED